MDHHFQFFLVSDISLWSDNCSYRVQARTGRGIHGLPKVSCGPALPNPYTQGGQLAAICFPLGYPTPYGPDRVSPSQLKTLKIEKILQFQQFNFAPCHSTSPPPFYSPPPPPPLLLSTFVSSDDEVKQDGGDSGDDHKIDNNHASQTNNFLRAAFSGWGGTVCAPVYRLGV
jgi:hypothetical protein